MAPQTGRTVSKFTKFVIGDSGNVLRSIPINTLSVVGVEYDEEDLTAWQDAVKGALSNMPDAPIEFGGPFDTSAAVAVANLSGSHTVLSVLNGLLVPRTIDIQIGIRQAWEAGEPQFGISQTATSGYIITKYNVDLSSMTYSAKAVLYPGSALPAWDIAAEA